MGERRKRKSSWDLEEENRHISGMSGHHSWTGKDRHSSLDSGRYHEFSESRTTVTRKPRDHSGYPPWESIEEDPISPMNGGFRNTHEAKEMGGGKRYYKDMSPGYDDGMEMQDYIHSQEYDRSHLQRYPGRARSRSRSRSRTGGRSPSRSYSRGTGRERGRGYSRSRSRSFENARDYSRSRSPIGDYRRQSYGWSERRNSSEKPSQICRNFAAGSCRRGSQCRFFHPNSMSRADGDLMEQDTAEDWRSRADLSRNPKQSSRRGSGFESWKDVSDPYRGEDEPVSNKSRSAVPCKDFARGKCRWGDTCRFLHQAASDGSFGQGNRNASYEKYGERQQYKNEKPPPCKFFAARKCDRKNCRFSHDDPNSNNLDSRPSEVTATGSSHDASKWWDGPTWDDDAARPSDAQKSTGWGESIVTNTTGSSEAGGGQNDNREGWNLEIEEKKWERIEHATSPLSREQQLSLAEKRGNFGGDSGPTESVANEKVANKQDPLALHSTWLHNQGGMPITNGHNSLQENQNVYIEPLQQNLYPASHIQETHGGTAENKVMNSTGSDALGDVKDTGYPGQPLFSGQSLNLNSGSMFTGQSSISNYQSHGLQNMLGPNPSNRLNVDLNVPETSTISHLNMQIQTQSNQNAVPAPGLSQASVPQILTDLLTSEHSAQLINSLTSSVQRFPPVKNPVSLPQGYGHTQANAGTGISGSRRMVPPFPDTSNLVNTTNTQGNTGPVSLDLLSSVGYGKGNTEHSNTQTGNINLEQSHPLPVSDDLKVKHPKSPTPWQEVVTLKPEVAEGNQVENETIKDAQENKQNEMPDVHKKVEEGSGNKDEKGMRIFKNSLVEFVKEILKPKWKEGRMSREVHKSVVKKVVDKISSSIQADHVPKTQEKVDQYLSHSKPKITKLVQAYVDRCLKAES